MMHSRSRSEPQPSPHKRPRIQAPHETFAAVVDWTSPRPDNNATLAKALASLSLDDGIPLRFRQIAWSEACVRAKSQVAGAPVQLILALQQHDDVASDEAELAVRLRAQVCTALSLTSLMSWKCNLALLLLNNKGGHLTPRTILVRGVPGFKAFVRAAFFKSDHAAGIGTAFMSGTSSASTAAAPARKLARHLQTTAPCWVLKDPLSNGGNAVWFVSRANWLVVAEAVAHTLGAASARDSQLVLQKYVRQPLLWKKTRRKFHFRVYALLLGSGDMHVYTRAFVHVANAAYVDGGSNDDGKCGDLTNVSQNVVADTDTDADADTDAGGQATASSSAAREAFLATCFESVDLRRDAVHGHLFWGPVQATMRQLGAAVSAQKAHLAASQLRRNDFALLGADFLPDRAGRLWLLEVNAPPCLSPQMASRTASERKAKARFDGVVDPMLRRLLCRFVLPVLSSVDDVPVRCSVPPRQDEDDCWVQCVWQKTTQQEQRQVSRVGPKPAGVAAFKASLHAQQMRWAAEREKRTAGLTSGEALWVDLHGATMLVPTKPGAPSLASARLDDATLMAMWKRRIKFVKEEDEDSS